MRVVIQDAMIIVLFILIVLLLLSEVKQKNNKDPIDFSIYDQLHAIDSLEKRIDFLEDSVDVTLEEYNRLRKENIKLRLYIKNESKNR